MPVDVHLGLVVLAQQDLYGIQPFGVFRLQVDLGIALVLLDHVADLVLHLADEVRVTTGQLDAHRREIGFG